MSEEKLFKFKASGISRQPSSVSIILDVHNGILAEDDIDNNIREASRLAEELALTLTPATTYALARKFNGMDYK